MADMILVHCTSKGTTTKTISLGARNMAIRQGNAFDRLVDCLQAAASLSLDDARLVANFYLSKKVRAVKLDSVTGQFTVTHGAYLDKDIILKALAAAKEETTKTEEK